MNKTYEIFIKEKTAEELIAEIKNACLEARREDRDIVILGVNGETITLEERQRTR